jgi:hypothetical protein
MYIVGLEPILFSECCKDHCTVYATRDRCYDFLNDAEKYGKKIGVFDIKHRYIMQKNGS